MACATPPTIPPAKAATVGDPPNALICVLVTLDANMKHAPTKAPSKIRDCVPVHKACTPPFCTMLRYAVSGPSLVVVTRVLTDSNGVPPDKSEAMRKKAPRAKVLATDGALQSATASDDDEEVTRSSFKGNVFSRLLLAGLEDV